MARAQNNRNFTFKGMYQLIAVTKAFPRCENQKNGIYFSLRLFNSGGTDPLFHLGLPVLLVGDVAVLGEDEEGEILGPNLAAVPSL